MKIMQNLAQSKLLFMKLIQISGSQTTFRESLGWPHRDSGEFSIPIAKNDTIDLCKQEATGIRGWKRNIETSWYKC